MDIGIRLIVGFCFKAALVQLLICHLGYPHPRVECLGLHPNSAPNSSCLLRQTLGGSSWWVKKKRSLPPHCIGFQAHDCSLTVPVVTGIWGMNQQMKDGSQSLSLYLCLSLCLSISAFQIKCKRINKLFQNVSSDAQSGLETLGKLGLIMCRDSSPWIIHRLCDLRPLTYTLCT